MNATIESLFGPSSEAIDIPAFILAAAAIDTDEPPPESSPAVAEECSVSDLRQSLFNTWNNPGLSAYLSTNHDQILTALYSTTKSTKQKRKVQPLLNLPPEVAGLQRDLEAVKLTSWKLPPESAMFIRHSKISDQNVLTQVKITPEPSGHLSEDKNAIITVSVHNRSTWSSGSVNRSSQHALLSSQTLGDLFKAIPCASNEIIDENSQTHAAHNLTNADGCAILIDNVVYGDGYREEDYAQRKLLKHLQCISKDAPVLIKSLTSIFQTTLSSLKLRINKPYWLLHKGNCEHFLVVDQIRLQHTADRPSGYPLTLQITPSLLDLCRACAKVPASLSVIGDIRLGESPCLLCPPCWRCMGDSSDPTVKVKQLPKYEMG